MGHIECSENFTEACVNSYVNFYKLVRTHFELDQTRYKSEKSTFVVFLIESSEIDQSLIESVITEIDFHLNLEFR